MNRLDKLIIESINSSLKSLLREDSVQGTFEQCLDMFDNQMSKYIQDQEKDDIMKDKLSVKEYEDPFGEKTIKNKRNNPAKK